MVTPGGAKSNYSSRNPKHSEDSRISVQNYKPRPIKKVKTLRSDGGGEFCNNEFRDWLANSGIIHQVTPPYTPQMNGVAERSNRTIVESARSQMYAKAVPLELWGLAIRCAVYVQNRTVSSTSNKTPYEHWYKRKPDISHLRVFGCRVFVHVPDEIRRKLDPKATEGMMMGYVEESTSCYKVGPKNPDKPMVLSNQLLISDLEPGIEKTYDQQRCHL
jgi:hypothetical protein